MSSFVFVTNQIIKLKKKMVDERKRSACGKYIKGVERSILSPRAQSVGIYFTKNTFFSPLYQLNLAAEVLIIKK